ALRGAPVQADDPASVAGLTHIRRGSEVHIRVLLRRPSGQTFAVWCLLGSPPLESLVPSILWFFLKLGLFLVGALVFWNRPTDRSAAQFFFLCIVTLGAYMGGYHWMRIVTQPVLLLVFMVCGVLLPAVSLHFYLTFPRPKAFLERHPRGTLLTLYGIPTAFLLLLVVGYVRVRLATAQLVQGRGGPEAVQAVLDTLLTQIYVYLVVAALLYVASVVCLLHSYVTLGAGGERNQVKWILFGA